MSEKRKSDLEKPVLTKKPRKAITLEVKREILNLRKSGMKVNQLAAKFKMPHSTVSTILKNKEKYLEQINNAMPMQSTIIRKRGGLIPEVEKVLFAWITQQNQLGHMPLDQPTICAMALYIFETIKSLRGEDAKNVKFNASKRWFERFRKRAGFHDIKNEVKIASTDCVTAKDFPTKMAKIIDEDGYCSQQVFNIAETSLFWKQMPFQNCTTAEQHLRLSFNFMEDRLTLLLGANAAGDFKLKPLLIYHGDNQKIMEDMGKTNFPVIWKYNSRSSISTIIFEDWLVNHFVPEFKKYCVDNGLPFKALLIMDNTPAYVAFLRHQYHNIKIIFLSPETSSFLQPMSQGVISFFKAYYLQQKIQKLIEGIDKDDELENNILENFDISDEVEIITSSWNAVSEVILKSVWKKLCPQFIQNLKDFEIPIRHVIESVIELAKQLDLEVSAKEVTEFLNSYEKEPCSSDPAQVVEKEIAKQNKEIGDADTHTGFTMQRLSEAFSLIEAALNIFRTDDQNFERSSKVISAIRDDFACYREIYQEKNRSCVEKSLEYLFSDSESYKLGAASDGSESPKE